MSEGSKSRKQLDELGKLNGKGATKQEAASAAGLCKAVAEAPDASLDARAAATAVGRELESPLTQEDAGRREVLMARAAFLAQRFS